jgi:CubicO group peptidase (beta-lactamase class C family)
MNETAASADPAYQAGIGGGHDIPYNQAAADYLINHVHSAQKAAIDDAAHLPNMDQPDEFRRIVTSFEEGGVPVTPQTLFAYGSICKNICAALVMRLVEEGRLHLDRPIVEYLPDLRFTNNETYGRQITLRHLLSHTSGLPNAGKYWGPRDPDALRRSVYEQVAHFTFLAEPGAVHLYSNMVICVAGHVAEAVTGRYYDDLVQEYVFDPLQMARTTFDPVVAMTYPVALPHESGPDGEPQVRHKLPYNASGNPSSFALGSVADLANLARMYLNRGMFDGRQFLTPVSVAEMQRLHASRHITSAAHPLAHANGGFGLSFNVGHYKGRWVARHGGMNPGYNCFFDLLPDDQAGFVLLTTFLPSQEGRLMELVTALYDAALQIPHQGVVFLDKPAAVALDSSQISRYSGVYLNVESADLITIAAAGDQLILERQEEFRPLTPIGSDEFYAEVSQTARLSVAFLFNGAGEAAHALIGGQPYLPVVLDPDFAPDLDLWQAYVGLYRDPSNMEPVEMVRVRLQDGVLSFTEGEEEAAARAIGNRCFLSELGLFAFEDTAVAGVKILVRGKAVRYYPLKISGFYSHEHS